MSSIWFDVTSSYAWNRPPVGAIRVETECAKHALTILNADVKFCRFVPGQGYTEVTRNGVQNILDRFSVAANVSQTPYVVEGSPARQVGAGRAVRLAARLRKIIGLLPKPIGARVLLYLARRKQAALMLVESGQALKRAARLWIHPTPMTPSPLVRDEQIAFKQPLFGRGDVYVSLGLDWDQKDVPLIASSKRAVGFKTIFCCYDLIPVKFPHLCERDVASKFARYFCDLAWCADEVLSISECSKRDLSELLTTLGAPVPTNTVITLGSDRKKCLPSEVPDAVLNISADRYILCVSSIERRKNHELLYKAYTRLLDQGLEDLPKLLLVGMVGWGVGDFIADIARDPRVKHRIIIIPHVSDSDLTWLYSNSLFTVFPSLYEGWGFGVAESLANGKMCLVSDSSSLPEVGRDLVEYIDPFDIPRWAERMRWYIENPARVEEAEARIKREYDAPTWKDTAEHVFNRARGLLAS